MLIDKKYNGKIFKQDGTEVLDAVIFRAQDLCFIPALDEYIQECESRNCIDEHLKGLVSLKKRVVEYQLNNPDKVKIPD